jgi:hypothetical protein
MVVAPLLDRIQRLQNAIPSNEEFRRVSADNEILQYETLNMLQNITADMPTQTQIQRILADINSGRVSQEEGVQRIEDAISGVSDAQLDALEDFKREVAESTPSKGDADGDFDIQAQIFIPVALAPSFAIGQKTTRQGVMGEVRVYIVYTDGKSEVLTGDRLNALKKNADFVRWYADNVGRGGATIRSINNYILSQQKAPPSSAVSDATDKETFSTEKSGFGLKAKNGRIRTKKIGAGVKYEPEPTYRQFGKYVINMPQLKERDILNVKFPSLGRIPQFKPTPISDVMKEFVLELLDTGKVSNRIYEQIPIEERKLFEKIATGAGILNALKLKRTISNEDKEDNDRFTLLKGEYLAGNNSVALLKELRKLVVKFMSQGKISKQDGMNLLIELSV